jgi:alcohol dehydrogenase, propanol-preferring
VTEWASSGLHLLAVVAVRIYSTLPAGLVTYVETVPCLSGHDASCQNIKVSGYYTPGTFQQYVVSAAHYVTPIPEGLDDKDAACHLCAGVTVYSALRKSSAKPGDTVAIIGAGGGLGHIAVQLASRAFNFRTIGIDAEEKKQLVLDSGAEHFIGIGSRDAPVDTTAEVKKLTNDLGVQAVIVVAAANGAYASSVPMLKYGGRVVCVGIPEGQLTAIGSAYPQIMIARELSIMGSSVGTRKDAIEVLDFAARGIVKFHVRVEKLDKLTEVSCYTSCRTHG